jgi:transcriptional regulator with XRE-family HTH domain
MRTGDRDRALGARIRARRIERGMTLQRVAPGVGMSWQQLRRIEVGMNRASAIQLIDIAKALDVDPARFLHDLGETEVVSHPGRRMLEMSRLFRGLDDRMQRCILDVATLMSPAPHSAL